MQVEMKVNKQFEITKEDFDKYERVRVQGSTNMFDLRNVIRLSQLDRETIMAIMKNYNVLAKKYKGDEQNE